MAMTFLPLNAEETSEKPDSSAVKKSKYEQIIEKQTDCQKGMFTVILSDGKVYFAIPDEMLGREFLFGSTVKSISDNANGVVGGKATSELQHVTFTKRDSTLLLRDVESEYVSPDGCIASALSKSNVGPIKKSFELKAWTPDSIGLYDLTPLFLEHDKATSPFLDNAANSSYDRKETFKKELSYLNGIKAFEDNVSVTSTMSYTYTMTTTQGTKLCEDEPLTAVLTRSFLLLPENIYTPRAGDYRIGYFHTERTQLGSVVNSTKTVYLTNRWKLEPSDTAAFLRGELVEPVKPITFYIDSDFPDWWKPYIHESVEQWNGAFERAGFKNAVVALDFPEDDPEFDPDNIKYSCIRYAPIGIQNAMGPSWVDPRSGEIITASVYVYHDIIKLLSRWMFIQTSQTDERVRHSYIPQDILGEGLRYVIRHEVGHCLGLMHNMGASAIIPVDSLRSPSFTAAHGTTTSIMDYARFNYVAQPGDFQKGVNLMPPVLGEYDKYAIGWGYRPVAGVQDFDQLKDITGGWITDSLKAGSFYRYGKQQLFTSLFDPRNQTEDLGDDVVKATRYGVKNLKYITENFMDWAGDDDEDYKVRTEYYNGILSQYLQYAQHVLLNVGGLYKDDVKAVDNQAPFRNVPREKQLECLNYLFEMTEDLDWLSNDDVVSRLPVVGSPERALRRSLYEFILMAPFFASRSDGVVTEELSSSEIFDILFKKVFGPSKRSGKLSQAERDFQKLYVTSYMTSGGYKLPSGARASLSFSSDAAPLCQGHLGCCSLEGEQVNLGDLSYSPVSGYEWTPRAIFQTGNISQGTIYAQLCKAHKIFKRRAATANATDKAHYLMLASAIEYGLGI